ncbi:MAG: hypothetical protein C4547_14265 [Phycisphaerales bacterium]|nr:MAG: hypothetical protein C4547_14265 [Phycisphaerales bacterium]
MIVPLAPRPTSPILFTPGDTVILCEGFDECALMRRLCNGLHKAPRIGCADRNSSPESELRDLAQQVRMGNVRAIGLMFDAECSRSRTETKLQRWLQEAELPVPADAIQLAESTLSGNKVGTAYLIDPHGRDSGAIEDYFLPQIRATRQSECIDQLLECYREHAPLEQLEQKVIVRTFVAHRNGRNTGLNAAFNAGILTCDGEEFDPVRRFLAVLRCDAAKEPAPSSRKSTRKSGRR